MELYELGMALSALLIAAIMDLPDVHSSHTGSRACPPYPAGPPAPVGSPHQGPTREVARARSASPKPTTDALAARPLDREQGAVLTSVTTSCRTTTGGKQPSRPPPGRLTGPPRQGPPAMPSAHCAAIPLGAIGLLAA
jgi:hypothetical protein